MEAVWAGRYVGDESLTHAVSELRKALGDNTKHPRYVQTGKSFAGSLAKRVTRGARSRPNRAGGRYLYYARVDEARDLAPGACVRRERVGYAKLLQPRDWNNWTVARDRPLPDPAPTKRPTSSSGISTLAASLISSNRAVEIDSDLRSVAGPAFRTQTSRRLICTRWPS